MVPYEVVVAAVRVWCQGRVIAVSEDALQVIRHIGVLLAPLTLGRESGGWSIRGTPEPDQVSSILTLPVNGVWISRNSLARFGRGDVVRFIFKRVWTIIGWKQI